MNILFVTCVWTICCKRAKWSKNLKRSSNQVFCCTPENSQCSCSSKRKKPLPKRHFWMLHIKHGANLRQVYCLYHIKMMLFPSVEAEKLPHFLQWWEIRIIPTVFCWESFSVSRFCKKSCICWDLICSKSLNTVWKNGINSLFLSYCKIGVSTINSGFFYLEQAESDESQVFYP